MQSKWQSDDLENCMEAIIDYRGKTPTKTNSGIPLVTAKIVKNGRIEQPEEFIAVEDYDLWMTRGLPHPGDVVLTTEAPLGEVAQLPSERVALAQRIILLRGKSRLLDNTFLKYCFMDGFLQDQLRARMSGTTVTGIKQSELRKLKLKLPPLPEQKAIARVLGSLDDKIELNRHMNATLEQMAQTLFRAWFVDFEPVKAKSAGLQPIGMDAETAALFPTEFESSTMGPIPKGWKIGTLDQLFVIHGGGTPKTSEPTYWTGDIPWYSVVDAPSENDVFVIGTQKKITRAGLEKSSTKLLAKGTIIISARGTVGRLAITAQPMAMNQSCYGLEAKCGTFYTFYAVKNAIAELQQNTHGAVFDTITQDTFKSVKVVCPSEESIQRFEHSITPLMSRIETNLRESQTLAQLRDALLPRLISGQLRVPEAMREVEAAL
jgi:type I restriction enzyme S subunit